MSLQNYFQENLYGDWQTVRDTDVIKTVYRGFDQLDWSDSFFVINFSNIVRPVDQFRLSKKIVVSSHFQTFDMDSFFQLINQYPDQQFLFLIDQNVKIADYVDLGTVFPNLTVLPWVTWHYQLESVIDWYGIADHATVRSKKISCVSGRQDIHKAIVSSFLLQKFDSTECECRTRRADTNDDYWVDHSFNLPTRFQQLLDYYYQLEIKEPHAQKSIIDQPILAVTDWHYTTFTDFCVNLPLESQFNDVTVYKDQLIRVPGPMFTEKTWKPLLAGQSFIPVGQYHSCQSLQQFGITFDLGVNLDFDQEPSEFFRLDKLLDSLGQLKNLSQDEISHKSIINAENNLQMIKSKTFFNLCEQHNQQTLALVAEWIAQ